MAALLARADRAIARSRELTAVIQSQRDQAIQQLSRMCRIGAAMGRPAAIGYPSDTIDRRPSDGSRRDGGSAPQ